MTTKITTTPTPLAVVDKINVLVDESSTNATNITAAKNASITGLSVSGKVITYTKGNGTTGTITTQDTNTTYSTMTASEATTGTATTARTITAKVLHDKIKELALSSSDALPIGSIVPFSGSTVPTGYLTCNGAAVSRTTYADLFAVIGTTYGAGNGSSTFNLPNLNNGSFPEGSDTVGTVKSAGLPNITGDWQRGEDSENTTTVAYGYATGAFFKSGIMQTGHAIGNSSGNYDGYRSLSFDASKSNAIYGNSDTVQPKSVTVKYIIKAFSSVTNTGNVDLQDIASDYERVNTELAKVAGISDYIIESYRNGTEWYEVYKSGKVRQGGIISIPNSASGQEVTVTLIKPFINTNYKLLAQVNNRSVTTYNDGQFFTNNKTTTSFTASAYISYSTLIGSWEAEGQGA